MVLAVNPWQLASWQAGFFSLEKKLDSQVLRSHLYYSGKMDSSKAGLLPSGDAAHQHQARALVVMTLTTSMSMVTVSPCSRS